MKILVTGAAGFLGYHLTRKLLDQQMEVIGLDNFFTGNPKHISELARNKNFSFIEHDVTEVFRIEVEQIYNLACPASPVHYQSDPISTLKTNVYGAMNVLELARDLNAKVFQASTSEVYGDPICDIQDEYYFGNVNPIGIRACYDEGKRAAETLFFDFKRIYNMDIRVARIFNTYGPNMALKDGRVVSNFITQALSNSDITIYGDGSQTRSFCYVDDLITGIISLMNSEEKVEGPINLGTDDEITMNDLAKKVIAITGSSSQIINKLLPKDDPKQRKPSLKLAKEVIDWNPRITLEKGLEETVRYFSELI